jgi:hypothetical protein
VVGCGSQGALSRMTEGGRLGDVLKSRRGRGDQAMA